MTSIFTRQVLKAALLCLPLLGAVVAASEKTPIFHRPTPNPKEELVLNILKLAVKKSGEGHKYMFESHNEEITEARLVSMVKDGSLSVMWAGTQPQYESELHPVRIPILKGLLGYRIFIIRQGDQHLFDGVNTFEDLRAMPLGQGRFWGDTLVLKNANMNVVTPAKYESLFYMLEGGRFDYFPRAAHELWSEVASRRALNLTVERNLLLIYPLAMYFFVSLDNIAFGRMIERGFKAAIEDGSFNQLFFNHPMIKAALENSNLKERKVFRIPNPYMSPETPLDDPSLWLDLESL